MQGQLGVDKKKPLIYIQKTKDDKYLDVHIGLQFFTNIPNDPNSIRYRLFVGELAMAGFSIHALIENFGFSRPTIMKYREIVRDTDDETKMFNRLRGYNSIKTKLIPEVEHYIQSRFPSIYAKNRATYNKQLRAEIQKKFDIVLSHEALRSVIAPLRLKLDKKSKQSTSAQGVIVDCSNHSSSEACVDEILLEEAVMSDQTQTDETSECHVQVSDPKITKIYPNLYAGLLILNLWIDKFISGCGDLNTTFLQWIYQIFFAAVNFEQARYFSPELLGELLGTPTAISVSQSRLVLKNLAREKFTETVKMLFNANLNCIQTYWQNTAHYFYIDGHFDPYYGKAEILKGWNCVLNRTMKGTNHYAIHDRNGFPVLKELKDCFGDFRDYIRNAIEKINPIMSGGPFGIVFDRGGFSQKLFADFQSHGKYFITWEKHFDITKEPDLCYDSNVTIQREINKVGQFKSVHFKCAETIFNADNFSCRKIIFCTHHKTKGDFYASILTNDPNINHQELVELMTNRWRCQENDFKYEKKHFGLDQITSFRVTPKLSIDNLINNVNADLAAQTKQQKELQVQKEALYKTLGVKRLTKKRMTEIEHEANEHPELYQAMTSVRALLPELKEMAIQINRLKKKLKRLKKIEEKGYVQLDYRSKHIFDYIRFGSRNIFYLAVNEFKSYYPNLRDYHEVFRKLIHASGHIEYSKEQIIVSLYCPFFTGNVLEAVNEFMNYLNHKQPIMLDGTNRKILFCVNSGVAN